MSEEQQTGRRKLDPSWVAAVKETLHETLTSEQDRAVRAANAAAQGQKPAGPTQVLEELCLNRKWIQNVRPSEIEPTEDGKGFVVFGKIYPNAETGAPAVPPWSGWPHTTVESLEKSGLVGLYEPLASDTTSQNLKKIAFDGKVYLINTKIFSKQPTDSSDFIKTYDPSPKRV